MMNCAWFVLRRGQSIVIERAYNDIAFYPVKMCTIHDEKKCQTMFIQTSVIYLIYVIHLKKNVKFSKLPLYIHVMLLPF